MNRQSRMCFLASWRRGFRRATNLLVLLALVLQSGAARAVPTPPPPFPRFSYDDGTAETLASDSGADLLVLNHFSTGGSPAVIFEIGVFWTPLSQINNPTLVLYSDPNGDGNPSDMQPLMIGPINMRSYPPGTIIVDPAVQYYAISQTVVQGSFFVGAFVSSPNDSSSGSNVSPPPFSGTPSFGIDTSGTGPGQSWMIENAAGQLNLQDPIATASNWENLNVFMSGNLMIDAMYYVPVPEPSVVFFFFLGSGTLMGVHRRLKSPRRF